MNKTTTPKTCLCGCKETTGATFRPGHDARMVSLLIDAVTSKRTTRPAAMKKLPSDALRAKLGRALDLRAAKATK